LRFHAGAAILSGVVAKALAIVVFLAGVALWAVGGWQIYEANTVAGALLVVAGAVVCVGVFTWWRRDPAAGASAVFDTIFEFFTRAP
jgi:cytochrome b subunit of formate dehydrogenase